jgi:hypothetical protein
VADAGGEQAVAPVAEGKLAAAHEAMLRAKDLQLDFAAVPEPPKPPGWLEWIAKAFEWLAPVLKWVFWIGLAAIAALILYFLARELVGVRLRPTGGQTQAAPAPSLRTRTASQPRAGSTRRRTYSSTGAWRISRDAGPASCVRP